MALRFIIYYFLGLLVLLLAVGLVFAQTPSPTEMTDEHFNLLNGYAGLIAAFVLWYAINKAMG